MNTNDFTRFVRQKGEELYRDMPWRQDTRPYYVLVSELMLQQTQVARVIPKFEAFIERFPNEQVLADASLAEVVILWQGLGYNRRAKFLHEAAKMIISNGAFPETYEQLTSLPGVGKNTAGAILAYSYDSPVVFVETNIRTVYIHHFFNDRYDVEDKDIISILSQTIDSDRPREFYWALMDYGSWLKSQGVRNISASKHYKKQAPLKGSVREMRGAILRKLVNGSVKKETLLVENSADTRFEAAYTSLLSEGLISESSSEVYLTK